MNEYIWQWNVKYGNKVIFQLNVIYSYTLHLIHVKDETIPLLEVDYIMIFSKYLKQNILIIDKNMNIYECEISLS